MSLFDDYLKLDEDPYARKVGKCSLADGEYEGELVGGFMPDGRGRMVYSDGSIYEGDWVGGQREGQGALTFPGSMIYEGGWKGGRPHGRFRITHLGPILKGRTEVGDWKNGKRHGHFTTTDPDGTVEEADYIDGEPQDELHKAIKESLKGIDFSALNMDDEAVSDEEMEAFRKWLEGSD